MITISTFLCGQPAVSITQPLTWWVNQGRSFVGVMWPQCESDHSAVPGANVLPDIPSEHGAQV